MILGFKKQFKDKTATNFKEQILDGTKIHSMRESDRWREDMGIQMAYGVRTKNYEQFNKGIEALSTCKAVQPVLMTFKTFKEDRFYYLQIKVAEKWFTGLDCLNIIKNDGLTPIQFVEWFFPNKKKEWRGYIIHWTDFKY